MNLGKFFRRQRLANGLTIAEAAQGVVSISQISRFERGETDLGVELFFELLYKLGSDLEIWQMEYMSTQSQSFIQGLDVAASKGPDGVKELAETFINRWQETGNRFDHCAAIGTKAALPLFGLSNVVTADEVNLMARYFSTVKTWGMFELAVLNMMAPMFDLYHLLRYAESIAQMNGVSKSAGGGGENYTTDIGY